MPNDTFPQQICQKCIKDLLIAFNFQKISIKTEETLKLLGIPKTNDLSPLSHDNNNHIKIEEIKQEILSSNKDDLNANLINDKVQSPNKIEVKNPFSTHEVEKVNIKLTKTANKVIGKKIQTKMKTKQLLLKNNSKKITHQEQVVVKPSEIRIKSLQSLQNQNPTNVQPVQTNNNAPKIFPSWVSPPPLVFLSESKTTPPPLVFLPAKTVDNCKYCEMKFTTEYDLKVHLLTHEINFNCVTTCHFCWETPKDLHRHLKEHYKFVTCAQCNIKFDSISKFENHMNEHLKTKQMPKIPYLKVFRQKECRICKVKLKTNENICVFCNNQEKYLCVYCGKEFLDYKLFSRHELTH